MCVSIFLLILQRHAVYFYSFSTFVQLYSLLPIPIINYHNYDLFYRLIVIRAGQKSSKQRHV